MKKYAVVVCNLFSNQNRVVIVDAASQVEACLKAVGDDPSDYNFETVNEVIQYYYNGEISVSEPVEIG